MRMLRVYALLFAAFCPCLASAQPADVTCTGTEPFWKLEIWQSEIYFQDGNKVSGQSEFELKVTKPRSANGAPTDALRIWEATTGGKRPSPVMTIIVQKREESKCADTFSDPIYPYDAIVITPRAVFLGCCK